MRVDIDVFGDVQFSREMLRMSDRAENMQPVFRTLAEDFHEMEEDQFNSEGGKFSSGWKALQISTLAQKSAQGHDPRILHATLALRNSLTKRSAPGAVYKVTREELVVGTNVKSKKGFPYAAAHQNPKKGQTRRRPIEFSELKKIEWIREMQHYLFGRSRRYLGL